MKLVNLDGRAALVVADGALDIADASEGEFGPDIQDLYRRWPRFRAFAERIDPVTTGPVGEISASVLGPVVPRPAQVFAVGLNYRLHAEEGGLPIPAVPLVFTKFPSSIAPPYGEVWLPTGRVDWEVEVAVVIGREASQVPVGAGWDHVAGITAAQDFSARDVQMAGGAMPQFSLGKSFAGFTPLGPCLVTPDEYPDRDGIGLECRINGELVQQSSTADLIFGVPAVISYLSHIVTLGPGDVILTGTPAGVGVGFDPPRFLADGDEVVTTVDRVGQMRHVCRPANGAFDATAILA
jgi:2,4-diketo-3-deoxy-L-fuconate hydrolase